MPLSTTHARRAAVRRLAARRGSVLPLVCFMLVVLLGAAALAIDLGRLNSVGTQAQAAADAAALAAAGSLMDSARTAPTTSPTSASSVAAANLVNTLPGVVPNGEVVPTTYSETNKTAVPASSWTTASAVRVGVAAPTNLIFGKAIGQATSATVIRRSTAWVANVVGAQCLMPIAIPYSDMYNATVVGQENLPNQNAPRYAQADMRTLHDQTNQNRSLILLPWGATSDANHPFDSWWMPVDYTGDNSAWEVGTQAAQYNCQAATTQVGRTVGAYQNAYNASNNNPASSYWATIAAGLNYQCSFNWNGSWADSTGRGHDARCYLSNGSIYLAPRLRFIFTDDIPGTGSSRQGNGSTTAGTVTYARQQVRMVALARLVCYFQSYQDHCSNIIGLTPMPKNMDTGYPPGTIVLYLEPLRYIDLAPDVVLGDSTSFTQRLIVVR